MKMRAAVLEEFGKPLVIQELDLAPAVERGLPHHVVRVVVCGRI